MRGLGILILIVLFFWLFWPSISRWLKRKAMERAETYIRNKMGMPPHYDVRESKKQSTYKRYYDRRGEAPIIPKEYAEDVEFIEIKEFNTTKSSEKQDCKYKTESQISDAEWTDVKTSGSKK